MSAEKLLLTIDDVASLTGFSKGTLYHWVSQHRITVVRFSRRCIKFRPSDIDKMISEKVEGAEEKSQVRSKLKRADVPKVDFGGTS